MNKKKPRILIVDDVSDNIQVLMSIFKDDCTILAATNGKKAIELSLQEPRPDLILLDIMMPDMDGYEVCKRLKDDEKTKDIPIIFVTVLNEGENELKGLELGAVDYITKPINPNLVKARVFNHLELKHHRDNLEKMLIDKEEMMIAQSHNASMGEMIGLIAHQWRQPISVISMIASNMTLDIELGNVKTEALKEYTSTILNQTKHLSKTIDDFRNFLLPNKVIDELMIEDVVIDARNLIEKSLQKHKISFSIENNSNVKIKIFSRELLQVFLSLIKNAKDAIVANRDIDGYINITINDENDHVSAIICDNGGGIDEANIGSVFDAYFSTKDQESATGLGLYMSKTIIENHLNGTISVENSKDGACFKVTIPKDFKSMLDD